jgi:hypothetical protein
MPVVNVFLLTNGHGDNRVRNTEKMRFLVRGTVSAM